jgi:hypothetical protein
MAGSTGKKVKKIRPSLEQEEPAIGLWIEPSLLPTRLAQRGHVGVSLQYMIDSRFNSPQDKANADDRLERREQRSPFARRR